MTENKGIGLTTDKEVSEMGMYELAHNACYIKDGAARYRNFEMDMDARDFARNLTCTLTSDELPLDDDSFDDEIMENLMYDPFSDIRGLIALFYRNLWAMADLREKLKEYEDAEKQGLLLKLPCKVGDTLYRVVLRNYGGSFVKAITLDKNNLYRILFEGELGKIVFLTKEEAEQALKQMGELA